MKKLLICLCFVLCFCLAVTAKSGDINGAIYATFDNVTIDKENETVSFRYDKDYTIDLKTGEYR